MPGENPSDEGILETPPQPNRGSDGGWAYYRRMVIAELDAMRRALKEQRTDQVNMHKENQEAIASLRHEITSEYGKRLNTLEIALAVLRAKTTIYAALVGFAAAALVEILIAVFGKGHP